VRPSLGSDTRTTSSRISDEGQSHRSLGRRPLPAGELAAGVDGSQADHRVHDDAAEKIQSEPRVETIRLMLQSFSQAVEENEKVDSVAGQDRDGVFDPATKSHGRDWLSGLNILSIS